MSRPIPRRLLPHKVTLNQLIGVDSWNKPTYSEDVIIEYVRVENLKKNIINSMGESKDDRAVLFIDSKNSTPIKTYSKGDKITFNSNVYTIREIDELSGDNAEVHHMEIALL